MNERTLPPNAGDTTSIARDSASPDPHDIDRISALPDSLDPWDISRRSTVTPTRISSADPRRNAILTDPDVWKYICAILIRRGVAPDRVDDLRDEVLAAAVRDPNLPLHDREEARLYLGGSARPHAITEARKRIRQIRVRRRLAEQSAVEPVVDPERRRLLRQTWRWLQEQYLERAEWLWRHHVLGEPYAEIAGSLGLSPSYVRAQCCLMQRAARDHALRLVVTCFLVFAFAHALRRPPASVRDDRAAASTVAQTGPRRTPAEMREQARRECARQHWGECRALLEKASRLDPEGDTPELQRMRKRAQDEADAPRGEPAAQGR